ncbi:MAG: hypothetical protein KAV82_01670 [Phycisphaerae bacterium]|nr:hypothetical protein [Phycisphaerae bacterium]
MELIKAFAGSKAARGRDMCHNRIPMLVWVMLLGICAAARGDETSVPPDQTPSVDETIADEVEPVASLEPQVRGVIIPITGTISDVTMESIQRRVEKAIDDGAKVVVFELDTPGGYVASALDICSYIKNLTHVKTVAWVKPEAYSAGSMISLACDEIVMSAASTLGDCGVILGTPTGAEAVPEDLKAKAESPVLEQFRDSAARNGYDRLLCESMVRADREVWWLENIETGEREFVGRATKLKRMGDEESSSKRGFLGLDLSGISGKKKTGWKLVETSLDPLSNTPFDIQQPVVSTTELLTLSQTRAFIFGFCKAIVSTEGELQTRYHLSDPVDRVDFTWSEVLVGWLTSMPVRGFLLILVFLGAYVEFNTPGVGVPGLVALICLAIFLGAPYLTGLANVWEIVVVLIGVALLGVEIFVIPGFGIAGISGLVLVIVGLLATFIPEEPGRSFPIYWPQWETGLAGLKAGVITLAAAVVTSLVGMVLLSRYLPQMPYVNRIVPENPTPSTVMPEDPYRGLARVGDLGICESGLRPAGKARFGSMLVDVVSEGEFLEAGARIEVIERYGNRVVVRVVRA